MSAGSDARALVDLVDATVATSGGKAATLGRLLAAGLPVPDGFVVPTCVYREALAGVDVAAAAHHDAEAERSLVQEAVLAPAAVGQIRDALERITGHGGRGYVAVRSSATSEDTAGASAAGQHDTILGVRDTDQVVAAVRTCWASLWSPRARSYRERAQMSGHAPQPPAMAVLVQALVDADVSGVLFTGETARIDASWGLGQDVVGGQITPDSWTMTDGAVGHRALGTKQTRLDRVGAQVVRRQVDATDRGRPCLTDAQLHRLVGLGERIERLLGSPQDVEWAVVGEAIWILQARPITATLLPPSTRPAPPSVSGALIGTPASPGRAAGPARIVQGPDDFSRVRLGDVLVCRTTDPAWTQLFGLVAAVVTETGGLLSHAAIVARELGLPAVVAVPNATSLLADGESVTVDAGAGLITTGGE